MNQAKLLEDTPEHYLITDPSGRSFIVPKKGLSKDQEKRIQALPKAEKKYAPVQAHEMTVEDASTLGDIADTRHKNAASGMQKSEDKLELNIGGHKTIIPRGDLSDEEWGKIIKDAQNKSVDARLKLGPAPTEIPDTNQTVPASKTHGYKGGAANFKGLPIGRLISQEIEGATPPKLDTSIDVKEPGGAVAPIDQTTPRGGAVGQAVDMTGAPAGAGGGGGSDAPVSPGGGSATPQPTGAGGGGGAPVSGGQQAPGQPVPGHPMLEAMGKAAIPLMDPNVQGVVKDIATGPANPMMWMASGRAGKELEQTGALARQAGVDIGNGQPPLREPQAPVPDQTPPPDQQPPPGPAPLQMPGVPQMGMPDRTAELDKQVKEFQTRMGEFDKNRDQIAKDRQTMMLDTLKRSQELQAAAQGAQNRMMEDQRKQVEAYNAVQSKIADPAQVNPDRFWQTHGRAWGALVGALAARQGRDPVATIQNAVRMDVEDQVAAFNSQRQLKADALEHATRPYDMLIKMGMDQINAIKLSQAMILEQMNAQATYFASLTDDVKAKTQAQELIMQNQRAITQLKQQADYRQQEISMQREKEITDRLKIKIEHEDRMLKLEAAKGGRPLPANVAIQQGAQKDVLNEIRGMRTKLEGMSVPGRFLGGLDPTGSTDAAQFNIQAQQLVPKIAKAIANSGRVTRFDMEYAQKLVRDASAMDAKTRYKFMEDSIKKQIKTNNEALKGAGFREEDTEPDNDVLPEDME